MNKLILLSLCLASGLSCNCLKHDYLYPGGIKGPSGYCRRELDLTILVDESSSIARTEWDKLIPFLKSLVRSLNLAPNYVHLSLVTFSTSIRFLISFLDSGSKDEATALRMLDLLQGSKPVLGFTFTGQALNFVRRVVMGFGARKNAPKGVILITDGASSQPKVTSQASAMLRDEGVTLLVVGVGAARSYECRSIVGCSTKGDCGLYFASAWDEIIKRVGELMTEVCETIPRDAVCKVIFSDWSGCSPKCGPGVRTKKVMDVITVVEETVGTNGKSGRSCEDFKKGIEIPQENCSTPCPEPEVREPVETEPVGEQGTGDGEIREEGGEEEVGVGVAEGGSSFGLSHDQGFNHEPHGDYPGHGFDGGARDGVDETSHRYSEEDVVHVKQEYKEEEFKRGGAKIAGGIFLAVLMLGAGGGYAFYKRRLGVRVGRFDADSFAKSLRSASSGAETRANHRKGSPPGRGDCAGAAEVEELRRFYLDQQRLFLNQLVIPSLNSAAKSPANKAEAAAKAKAGTKPARQWECRVSDGSSSLRCSVLSNVPKGTVLVRPSGSRSEFISVPVLSTLLRTRPNIMKILFPKHEVNDLNELHRYSSLTTLLVSHLCSNDALRRALVTLSVLYGIKTAREVILDLFFYTIRSDLFWNRTVYALWSRSLSLPVPLLILTLNSLLTEFFNLIALLDGALRDSLVQLEGNLMNRDLGVRFSPVYVADVRGKTRLHSNHFD